MTSSLRLVLTGANRRSVLNVFFIRRSGMPPNRPTSGFLPVRSTRASKTPDPISEAAGLGLVQGAPAAGDLTIAQVDAFGFGGINAVAIVEAAR